MKTLSHYLINNILTYGIIAGLLIIIVRAAVYLFDISTTNTGFTILNFVYNIVVLSVCLYLGTINYRKKTTTGNLTYGKGLLVCISTGFVAIFLIFIYDIVFYTIIAPDYLANMLEPQIAAISGNPSIPPVQKIQLMKQLEKYTSPSYFSGLNALMSFGISIIISLITAIFTVRKRPIVNETSKEIYL